MCLASQRDAAGDLHPRLDPTPWPLAEQACSMELEAKCLVFAGCLPLGCCNGGICSVS